MKKQPVGAAFLSGIFIVMVVFANAAKGVELTPEEGLKRLSDNIAISTKNRDEYQKSLQQVERNLASLDSSSQDLQNQKKKLLKQISENKATLTLHSKKLQELDRAKLDEERKKADELNKITQLENALTQLKDLQTTRQERLQKIAQDRATIETSQKQGDALQLTLASETKELDQRLESLKKETSPWKTKKKLYEKESVQWNQEVDRHQKMEAEVKLLLDSTT